MPSTTAVALFWVAVAVCALAQLALLHSFFLGASRPARDKAASFRATETTWAILPAVILVALLASTWNAMHPAAAGEWRVTVPANTPVTPMPENPAVIAPGTAPAQAVPPAGRGE